MATVDFKELFKGKKKWIAIGAIAFVVVLAFFMRKSSSSSGYSSVDTIAQGAAAPGVTTTDIQNAISEYAAKDAENTADLFDKFATSNNDALNSIIENSQAKWESVNDTLTEVQEQNSKTNQSLLDQMINQFNQLNANYQAQFEALNNQAGPGYASGGSSGGSSSSSSNSGSSSTVVTGSATTSANTSGGSFQDAANQYIEKNPGLSDANKNIVQSNADRAQEVANQLQGWRPSKPIIG